MSQLPPTAADLPVELVIRIVSFATETNLEDAKKVYLSLVHVSSRMQEIAHAVCLPQFPIMLHTRESLYSFHALLKSHPTTGSVVRNLWLHPNFSSSEEQEIGGAILLACQQLERLACGITLLNVLIQIPPPVGHDHLRELAITSKKIGSEEFIPRTCCPTLFVRLTHFRSISRRYFDGLPFVFSSLTHVSFPSTPRYYSRPGRITFDSTNFPALQHIVPTVPYELCHENPRTLRADARRWSNRMEMLLCPKNWDESKIWEMAGRWGEPSIWERAASGNDIDDRAVTPWHSGS